MNKAIFTGNLTRDPESRTTPNGVPVCTFTVAVQRKFKNQQGERDADYLPVVAWRQIAELCGQYLHKGSKVGITGSIQTRTYDANDGSKRYVTEIIADEVEFLTPKGAGSDSTPAGAPYNGLTPTDDDEDIPF